MAEAIKTALPHEIDPREFDGPAFQKNPFELYQRLRDHHPIFHDRFHNRWIVSRYWDVDAVFQDSTSFDRAVYKPDGPYKFGTNHVFGPNILEYGNSDEHRRLRNIVAGQFVGQKLDDFIPMIHQISTEVIERFKHKPTFELVKEFSSQVPIRVISNMLGLPREDEDTFVEELIAGLDAFPGYYAHMGPANQSGAGPIDLSLPVEATADEIARRIAAGEWVVDLRHRHVFAADHVKGSLSFEVRGNAVTYLGWMIDWGTPITLLGTDVAEVLAMQRELVRIGIDRPVGYAVGTSADWASSSAPLSRYRRASHVDLAQALAGDPNMSVLDLRRNAEFDSGHVLGAKHVPLHELRGRIDEVRRWADDNAEHGPVWAYCGSGFRASIGASLLDGLDIPVVHVDDDFSNAEAAGLTIVRPLVGHRLGAVYAD